MGPYTRNIDPHGEHCLQYLFRKTSSTVPSILNTVDYSTRHFPSERGLMWWFHCAIPGVLTLECCVDPQRKQHSVAHLSSLGQGLNSRLPLHGSSGISSERTGGHSQSLSHRSFSEDGLWFKMWTRNGMEFGEELSFRGNDSMSMNCWKTRKQTPGSSRFRPEIGNP